MAIVPELIKVFIIEDENLVRDTLAQSLELVDNINVVGTSENISSSIGDIKATKPDVLIVDVRLKNENGIEASKNVLKLMPAVKIIILSGYFNDSLAANALAAGASAFLSKSIAISHLVAAIFHVMVHNSFYAPQLPDEVLEDIMVKNKTSKRLCALSKREKEVLQLIAKEYSTKDIATMLGISEKTVRNHKSNIMAKLGITSHVGLIKYAYYMAMI
ncbi:MAG: response regulator transcription factor [Spirochaetes bacterium]|nr:response regulator transcription factor [Spirochaetota bacterium]NMB63691.1 response regulator transcription factor [Spirochaetota bacterium]HOJ27536.1 response regulator transcription factor [Spirochaetota bacterium]HOM08618.1 response regulator transcription factor [Spirochaetota bacterium]HPP48437.1 response regulator transcription factor [Spirochaetota bacterium]